MAPEYFGHPCHTGNDARIWSRLYMSGYIPYRCWCTSQIGIQIPSSAVWVRVCMRIHITKRNNRKIQPTVAWYPSLSWHRRISHLQFTKESICKRRLVRPHLAGNPDSADEAKLSWNRHITAFRTMNDRPARPGISDCHAQSFILYWNASFTNALLLKLFQHALDGILLICIAVQENQS